MIKVIAFDFVGVLVPERDFVLAKGGRTVRKNV